ncbi:MAG: hypothetical protein KKG60_04075 [Nanoarchaeota archaeon]|nr:hypothetical protein [Nanoarchaeota archaeon]
MKKGIKIIYLVLIAFVIYLIIEVIRKLIGGSLGTEELVLGLLIANLGYSFSINYRISDLNSKVSEHLGWHKGRRNSH